jgi:hypothetical protein
MYLSKTDNQITHPIIVDRDYYIARVGRCLEVRCKQTHAVLQVLEPPKEWGENWLWSSCGFDGTICVPLDVVRFVKTDAPTPSGTRSTAFGNSTYRPVEPPPHVEPGVLERADAEQLGPNRQQHPLFRSTALSSGDARRASRYHGDDAVRSSSRIHAGVSLT